jgi:hypothetical protein
MAHQIWWAIIFCCKLNKWQIPHLVKGLAKIITKSYTWTVHTKI